MSLINKMLQDLDARGSSGASVLQLDIKPVAREERRLSQPLALGLLGGAALIAVLGAVGWRYLQKPPAAGAVVTTPAVVVMQPAPQALPTAPPGPAPAAPAADAGAAPAAGQGSARATDQPAAPVANEGNADAGRVRVPVRSAQDAAARTVPFAADKEAKAEAAPATVGPKAAPPKLARVDADARPKTDVAATAAPARPAEADTPRGNSVRRGEDAYRRALASLQEGRITETIALLEQALQVEPRHDAARQTLIGLLVESGRVDDAMRQLQQALGFDARQPALAMLLARLQIERGASGIETLTRSLPYANGNGEYQAFLAGALQRQGRHVDAADQYQAALRGAPGNGVWWMGLGISLQATRRDADALTAFRRAHAAGNLTPELLAFVERKLQQLER